MKRDPQATREKILRAAAELFYGEGIRSVGVDAVAKRAGVTKRTLYYHFRSKDELIVAYLEARNGPTIAWLTTAAMRSGTELVDRIEGLFAALAGWGKTADCKGCPFARAVAELAGVDTHPALVVAAQHKAELEGWLKDQIAAAGLSQPALHARQLMVLVDGAITQMVIQRDPAYAEAARQAARVLLMSPAPRAEETP